MRSDNLTGILLMIVSMGLFAVEDTFIKLASQSIPVGEILVFMGAGGIIVFSMLMVWKNEPFAPKEAFAPMILGRMASEIVGRVSYSLALAFGSMAVVAAVLQATPLAVTMGAALMFGEKVGLRRWTAIFVGFAGVLIILRPGLEGFEPAALLSIVGMFALAFRDLATRAAPKMLSNRQLGLYGFVALVPSGLFMLIITGGWENPLNGAWPHLLGMSVFGICAYYLVTAAMRIGEVAVVTPFRYSRIIFALIISVVVFSEQLDSFTLVGAALVIASGLYTMWRENLRQR
ncbi:MAG: DMT family transporter [Paracoccaceae bacterium]|nr:DMT family transporter [Paracoccaceae bacterium]MDG2259300.1 DMT family transporter [Paracoccaceae bacterium]